MAGLTLCSSIKMVLIVLHQPTDGQLLLVVGIRGLERSDKLLPGVRATATS
jgi:hypothetical protein